MIFFLNYFPQKSKNTQIIQENNADSEFKWVKYLNIYKSLYVFATSINESFFGICTKLIKDEWL